MNKTAASLLSDASYALLEALWAEANAMGPNTDEIVKYMTSPKSEAHSSAEQVEHVRQLLGPDATTVDVLLKSLDMHKGVMVREEAVRAYIKARRLAESTKEPVFTDGEPTFTEQVNTERQRQIDKGYTAEHDDEKGIEHLRRIRDSYPVGSVKRAAMARAVLECRDRSDVIMGSDGRDHLA